MLRNPLRTTRAQPACHPRKLCRFIDFFMLADSANLPLSTFLKSDLDKSSRSMLVYPFFVLRKLTLHLRITTILCQVLLHRIHLCFPRPRGLLRNETMMACPVNFRKGPHGRDSEHSTQHRLIPLTTCPFMGNISDQCIEGGLSPALVMVSSTY